MHTQRNLLGLRVSPASSGPVFAGESAAFRICLRNDSALRRRGIRIEAAADSSVPTAEVAENEVVCVTLAVPARKRGRQVEGGRGLANAAFLIEHRDTGH